MKVSNLLATVLLLGIGYGAYRAIQYRISESFRRVMERQYEDQWTLGPEWRK